MKHHFGLDGKTKVVAGLRKATHPRLHLLLMAGIYLAVVSEQKVSENILVHLPDSLQPPGVEKLSVGPVPDAKAKFTVSKSARQHD